MFSQIRCYCIVAVLLGGLVEPQVLAEEGSQSSEVIVPSALITLIHDVEVPARATGVLMDVQVHEGMRVEAGDVLAELDSAEAAISVQTAEAQLAIARHDATDDVSIRIAEKTKAVAEAELQRAEESNQKFRGSVSESELDRLRLSVDQAALEIERAKNKRKSAELTIDLRQTERDLAEEVLSKRRIVAPFDGRVVRVDAHQGEWVQPGETLCRLVTRSRVRAEGFLDATAARGELEGRPVVASIPTPDGETVEFRGKVTFVDPQINVVDNRVAIWAELENQDELLRPGQRIDLRVLPE